MLELLKDMVENASFLESELKKEKEVIIKEMSIAKDDPQKEMIKILWERAYIIHPYRYPVIGYKGALEGLRKEDVVKYYNRMYLPNRMVLSIAGDIDTEAASGIAEDVFRDFSRPSNYRPIQTSPEPLQLAPRSLEKPFETSLAYMALAYHSTSLLDDDLFKLDVLAMILGQGDNSRLNKTLFKADKIVYSVSSSNYTPMDPGLFLITTVSSPENLGKVASAIKSEIEKLKSEPVSDEELERAKKSVLAQYLVSLETAGGMAQAAADGRLLTGSYDFSFRYTKGVEAVTKEDLLQAARKFLKETSLTIVKVSPKGSAADDAAKAKDEIVQPKPKEDIVKEVLPNGIRVIVRRDEKIPMVSMTIASLGGLLAEDAKTSGLSHLTAGMLLKGTSKRREDEIVGAVESRGGSMEAFSGWNSFGVKIGCFKDDLDLAIDLAKDALTDPVFPDNELDKEKALALAAIKREEDDILAKGLNVFRKTLFKDHPYGFRIVGEIDTIGNLKRDDLAAFHREWCVPENIVIALSGDINARETLDKMKTAFSGMGATGIPSLPRSKSQAVRPPEKVNLKMPREESLVLLGYRTITLRDPDRYPFALLASILSGSSGRLFSDLRDTRALAYSLGVFQGLGIEPGYFLFYVATTREKVESAKKELAATLDALLAKGVSVEEVESAKKELITAHRSNLQRNGFVSFQMALDELYGLGYENTYHYDESIERVTKDDVNRIIKKYFSSDAPRVEVMVN
jgi:zinc protease